jgi:hypothetical protein
MRTLKTVILNYTLAQTTALSTKIAQHTSTVE